MASRRNSLNDQCAKGKSRLAFLSRLCGGTALYVINDAALGYMKDRQLPQAVIDKLADHKERIFSI
jgi:hypothetical protein